MARHPVQMTTAIVSIDKRLEIVEMVEVEAEKWGQHFICRAKPQR